MSHTTFSNMSNPDMVITVQAYALMKRDINDRLETIQTISMDDEVLENEQEVLQMKLTRVNELSEALVNEYSKRETY